MKRYLLLALASLFSVSLYAQENVVIKASKKTTLEATPKQIIDSLKKKFPNAQAIQSYKTSAAAAKNGWQVSDNDNLGQSNVDRYTLSFKNNNFKYYALFEPDGTLIRSKYEQYGATLPAATKESAKKLVGGKYKGYKVLSKTYYKTVDYDEKKNYYEVIVQSISNANIKKTVTIDDAGNITKVRDN